MASLRALKPVELAPEWLTESPITFDDLRCTSYPATLWRVSVSVPPSPAIARKSYRRESVASVASSSLSSASDLHDAAVVEVEKRKRASALARRSARISKLAAPVPGPDAPHTGVGAETSSFLFYDDEDAEDVLDGLQVGRWKQHNNDDDATLNEPKPEPAPRPEEEDDPSPIDPFFKAMSPTPTPAISPAPSPVPLPPCNPHENSESPAPSSSYAHSRGSSFDWTSPWFMHVSAHALAALDDQLLQSPTDAFADMCYASAVALPNPTDPQHGASGAYSWRRFSRLRPLSPGSFSDIHEEDEGEAEDRETEGADGESTESETDDEDEEQLASPEEHAPDPAAARLAPSGASPPRKRWVDTVQVAGCIAHSLHNSVLEAPPPPPSLPPLAPSPNAPLARRCGPRRTPRRRRLPSATLPSLPGRVAGPARVPFRGPTQPERERALLSCACPQRRQRGQWAREREAEARDVEDFDEYRAIRGLGIGQRERGLDACEWGWGGDVVPARAEGDPGLSLPRLGSFAPCSPDVYLPVLLRRLGQKCILLCSVNSPRRLVSLFAFRVVFSPPHYFALHAPHPPHRPLLSCLPLFLSSTFSREQPVCIYTVVILRPVEERLLLPYLRLAWLSTAGLSAFLPIHSCRPIVPDPCFVFHAYLVSPR
ncbi:hypothetical protein BD310DRAFT_1015012 [Dichomitus squalens]|uniref:Uncharacterized protein n=1 Tax=Dichomitus squalens TaxID=114155 RepID=A0A4Q9PV18_9APHY|nr:hypothetical protein BD310DRAFT_1015012 [Dichomitus squalens]